MRYFTYIAEQSFKTSETGERLFYRGGVWSRPYIVPDAETEERLYWKQVWMLRFTLGSMIVGQPFLFILYPQVLNEPYWFFAYLFAVMAVSWVIGLVVFTRDLKSLKQASDRLRPRSFFGQMAKKHSRAALTWGFLGSLLFVATGILMWTAKVNQAAALFCIGFFGLCAIAWGYAFYLKLLTGDSTDPSGDERRDVPAT